MNELQPRQDEQKTYQHSTVRSDYTITVRVQEELQAQLREKHGVQCWKSSFTAENIKDITSKTGCQMDFPQFSTTLLRALSTKDISCYIDILSSQDVLALKAKNAQTVQTNSQAEQNKIPGKANKRYLILTYMTNENKYHYPLSLAVCALDLELPQLKAIYVQLRVELEAARASALNDTHKSESFSIQLGNKGGQKHQARVLEVDQHRSQNEMLKAKLARLEQQTAKKKANIEIEAAIERTKQLQTVVDTTNQELVDWKNSIMEQENTHNELKKEMNHLHRRICGLLTSEKEVVARKKGEDIEKELNQVRGITKKYTAEIDKLKREWQASKTRVKELQIKAKKLNSEKEVIRKGKRGPYSSAGSVRSYNSYSSKRSYNSSASGSSKARSNYTSQYK